MNISTSLEIRPDQEQPVVGGQVLGVFSTGATFQFATVRVVVKAQAHQQPAVREPGPLVGEGALKREALRREIDELEADYRAARSIFVYSPLLSATARIAEIAMNGHRQDIAAKRRELVALAKCGPTDRQPSPTNEGRLCDSHPAGES